MKWEGWVAGSVHLIKDKEQDVVVSRVCVAVVASFSGTLWHNELITTLRGK